MSNAALAQRVLETVSRLPDIAAKEVLDFATYLESKQSQSRWNDLQNAQLSALTELWDNDEDEVWNDA